MSKIPDIEVLCFNGSYDTRKNSPGSQYSTIAFSEIVNRVPIPNGQLDLHLQRVPDLPVSLRPCLGLRETLLGLPPMLGIGGRDPCEALLGPWTGGPPTMQPAPPGPSDRGPLTFHLTPGFGETPIARPVRTEAGREAESRSALSFVGRLAAPSIGWAGSGGFVVVVMGPV